MVMRFASFLLGLGARPGISYDYVAPTNTFPMNGSLWKQFFQDRQVQPQLSSELLVGGVVVEVHLAGGVDLLLGAELRW